VKVEKGERERTRSGAKYDGMNEKR